MNDPTIQTAVDKYNASVACFDGIAEILHHYDIDADQVGVCSPATMLEMLSGDVDPFMVPSIGDPEIFAAVAMYHVLFTSSVGSCCWTVA